MQKQTISLQKKLVKTSVWGSVFAGSVAFVLLLGISSYQTMSINDEIMDEISDMLLIADITSISGHQIDELSEEFDIEYQLIFNHDVLSSTKNYPKKIHLNGLNEKGYSFIWYKNKIYRTFINYQDDPNFYVKAIQPLEVRFKGLWHTVVLYLFIVIVLWFLQWIFVHLAIGKQFKSILTLSDKISKRSASNLEPIIQQPIEIKELQSIVAQLNHLLERLQASMLAEQRFTADASHELRSPLSAIQMRLQLLQRKYQYHSDFQKDIKQIQIDVNRNQYVLENLLLLARLDPTQAEKLPKRYFNLDEIIQEVLNSLEPFSMEKHIEYKVDKSAYYLTANQELIYTCVRNILDNSIRYEKENGQIFISFHSVEKNIEIIIEDTCDKVDENVLKHLGERFYRALGTKTNGSGLGLSICKKIMELHGGSISFSRSQYGGLKVTLKIPQ